MLHPDFMPEVGRWLFGRVAAGDSAVIISRRSPRTRSDPNWGIGFSNKFGALNTK